MLTSYIAPLPHYRGQPSALIAGIVVEMARQLQLPEVEVDRIRIAALLHDVGKVAVPQEILDKPAPLSSAEWRSVVQHPRIGQVILEHAAALRDAVPIILHHHERYGGHGYPYGLRANEIPLGARIVAIADAYDAMTHDRPYKRAMSHDAAIAELRQHAGTQFDPSAGRAVLRPVFEPDPRPDPTVVPITTPPSRPRRERKVRASDVLVRRRWQPRATAWSSWMRPRRRRPAAAGRRRRTELRPARDRRRLDPSRRPSTGGGACRRGYVAVQPRICGGAPAAARVASRPPGASRPRRPADPPTGPDRRGRRPVCRPGAFHDDARMLRLAFAVFAVQAGFHAFTASLPVALARAGVPDPQIGLIVGTAALVQIPAAFVTGVVVDRVGGVRAFTAGGLAYIVGCVILLLPGVEPGGPVGPFLVARVFQGIGIAAILPAALSLVPRLVARDPARLRARLRR